MTPQIEKALPIADPYLIPEIKAISLTQPWASLIVRGAKRMETRSWAAGYRGWVAIHASSKFPRDCRELMEHGTFKAGLGDGPVHIGGIVGLAYLKASVRTEKAAEYLRKAPTAQNKRELTFGDYSANRWAYCFTEAFETPLIKLKGSLKFFDLPASLQEDLKAQVLAHLSKKGGDDRGSNLVV